MSAITPDTPVMLEWVEGGRKHSEVVRYAFVKKLQRETSCVFLVFEVDRVLEMLAEATLLKGEAKRNG